MGDTNTATPDIQTWAKRVEDNVARVIVGKRGAIRYLLIALLCQGHVLIEDVPGVGKTTLVRALARSLDCEFRRVQFTPDLLPADIAGTNVLDQTRGEFVFRPGPLMGQVILADEINRASPKTQSALLEAMEERQVTVDGVSHPLPEPFMVLATQNPIEYEGTFPLPEAQLDRFLVRIHLGYPSPAEEVAILDRLETRHPLADLEAVTSTAEVLAAQRQVSETHVSQGIKDYVARITRRTRDMPELYLGASPRATLALFRAARALAAMSGRTYVIPDDVKEVATPVLAHRLILKPEARLDGTTAPDVVTRLLTQVPIPLSGGVPAWSRPGPA
ncbi:MAG TPA: MoxR family ATPase [Firmicutes bacterium]|nr:MoxR family ATPase [Bacillota bacterium]